MGKGTNRALRELKSPCSQAQGSRDQQENHMRVPPALSNWGFGGFLCAKAPVLA